MYRKLLTKTYYSRSPHHHCSVCGFCANLDKENDDELLMYSSILFGPCLLETIIHLLDLLPSRFAYKLGLLHEYDPQNENITTEETLDTSISSMVMKCKLCQQENCIMKGEYQSDDDSQLHDEIEMLFDKLSRNNNESSMNCTCDVTESLSSVLSKLLGGHVIIKLCEWYGTPPH